MRVPDETESGHGGEGDGERETGGARQRLQHATTIALSASPVPTHSGAFWRVIELGADRDGVLVLVLAPAPDLSCSMFGAARNALRLHALRLSPALLPIATAQRPRNVSTASFDPAIRQFLVKLAEHQPCFSIPSSAISIMHEPRVFYQSLLVCDPFSNDKSRRALTSYRV